MLHAAAYLVLKSDGRCSPVKATRAQVRDSENAKYNRTTWNTLSMARSKFECASMFLCVCEYLTERNRFGFIK